MKKVEYRRQARAHKRGKMRRRFVLGTFCIAMITMASVSVSGIAQAFSEPVEEGNAVTGSALTEPEKAQANAVFTEPSPSAVPGPEPAPEEAPEDGALPASEAVEESYFDDAVFIGDSRTEGLITGTGLYNAVSYTHKGLMVDTVFTELIVNRGGVWISAMEALKYIDFSKVYVMFGINETGWPYNDVFIEKYGRIIDTIKEINPNAIIYVQQIIPVSESVSSSHSYIKNSKIEEFNRLIRDMAEEKQVCLLNPGSALCGGENFLPSEAALDGIHLNREYCALWLDYLKTHTYRQ